MAVGRSPIPTVTGITHRLDWLAREAALDGTPLTVVGDPLAAPLHAGLLREGESVGALWERSRGAQTSLIGLTWVDGFQAVVALPGGGASEPAQLAGHRVGVPFDTAAPVDARRAAARRGLHAALALAGSFPDEVDEVDVAAPSNPADPYAAELEALLRGEVDAIYLAGAPGMAAAARIGAVAVADLGAHLDPLVRSSPTTPALLTVDTRLLEHSPLVVIRLLAVLLRAGVLAQAHPHRARRLVAAETATTSDDVRAAYGTTFHQQLQLDLSERKLGALAAQYDFLRTHGFLEGDVDVRRWVDPRPLAMARELLAAERTAYA